MVTCFARRSADAGELGLGMDLSDNIPIPMGRLFRRRRRIVEFLNHVARDRWSRMETTVDGETRKSPDARLLETRPEDDGTGEEAPGTDDALLPEAPASETVETASGDTPTSWTQQMRERFPEIPEGDGLPSTSQFDYIGLSQFLPSTPAHSPVSSESSKDSSPERIDMARDREGHVPTVSRVPETDPVPATVVPAAPAISEAKIAALVATSLRRYSQAMVWDVPIDETEHLAEPACSLGSLHECYVSKGEDIRSTRDGALPQDQGLRLELRRLATEHPGDHEGHKMSVHFSPISSMMLPCLALPFIMA
jgi:hypothetical protein